MAAYFSAERVQELLAGQHQVHLHFTDLRETMCVRPIRLSGARNLLNTAFAAAWRRSSDQSTASP